MGKRKSPEESPTPGALVAQPHGGAIRHGSTEGNTPGTGRPPSKIREQLRGSFSERVAVLEAIADGRITLRLVGCCEKCGHEGDPLTTDEIKTAIPQIADRLKAIDMLAKYGLGTQQEVSGPDGEPLFKVYQNVDTDAV